jgi:hypothetical protein
MIDRMDTRLPACRLQGLAHVARGDVGERAVTTKKITTTKST